MYSNWEKAKAKLVMLSNEEEVILGFVLSVSDSEVLGNCTSMMKRIALVLSKSRDVYQPSLSTL